MTASKPKSALRVIRKKDGHNTADSVSSAPISTYHPPVEEDTPQVVSTYHPPVEEDTPQVVSTYHPPVEDFDCDDTDYDDDHNSNIRSLATVCLIAGAIISLYAIPALSNPLASFSELALIAGAWLINIGVSLFGGLAKYIDSESDDQSADKPRMGFMMKLIVFVAYLSFPTLLITIFTIILKSGDVVAIPRLMNCFTFSLMVMITSGAICTGRAIANKLNS